jgi:hypothetical protein
MIIDIVFCGEQVIRYESDCVPRVGETISCMKPKRNYEVKHVDHLIRKRTVGLSGFGQDLVTVEVI